jgi:hypothetical protein
LTATNPLGEWKGIVRTGRKRGFEISKTSCGGQPADVATLPSPTKGENQYIFFSDLWNNAAGNEALATHYWEPLSFNADGSIKPLTCASTFNVSLSGIKAGQDVYPKNNDQSSGRNGFRFVCDINATSVRAQTFTAGKTGFFVGFYLTAFQAQDANGELMLSIVEVNSTGSPGKNSLWSKIYPSNSVSWAPNQLHADLTLESQGIKVVKGRQYAIVATSFDNNHGCFGVANSLDNPYESGASFRSFDGGNSWLELVGNDIKFDVQIVAQLR